MHRANADFWQDYGDLPTNIRERAKKQFALLKENPRHHSLQFKKLTERRGQELWSARVTLESRALAVKAVMIMSGSGSGSTISTRV